MQTTWCRSTFSLYRLQPSEFCSSSLSFATTVAVSFIFNVTEHPSAEWTAQQMVDAFPWDTAPRYLVRDRDQTYGAYFDTRVDGVPSILFIRGHQLATSLEGRDESKNKRRNHVGMVPVDRRLIKFGARG